MRSPAAHQTKSWPVPSAVWLAGCLVVLAILIFTLMFVNSTPAWAAHQSQAPVEPGTSGPGAGLSATNYCVGCHIPSDERLQSALTWNGPIERQVNNPCPASATIYEELYYTERLMLAIDRLYATVPHNAQTDKIYASAQALEQTYSRLLDTPLEPPAAISLDGFVSEAQNLRYRLGKSYTQLTAVEKNLKSQRSLIAAILVTLVVLASLAWGYYNAQKALSLARGPVQAQNSQENRPPGRRFNYKPVLFVLLILILFALPIFKEIIQAVAGSTAIELERQDALDTASRLVDTSDRSLARAWSLAEVGAQWSSLDAAAADQALADALSGAEEAQRNAFAMWGKAQTAQEITVGDLSTQQQAGLVADELAAMRSRAWGLRLAAHEWIATDPARAAEILDQALKYAQQSVGSYHDLDLRAIAVTYAILDAQKGAELAGQVADPALRAWGLREIAVLTGQEALYSQAAQAAALIEDPIQRARALREIALQSGETALFAEALAALDQASGAAQAYGLSELAAVSQDAALIERISAAYPAARALALAHLGQYEPAWKAAALISDPYERAHAQAFIANAWQNADTARQIDLPLLRDRALRDITAQTGDSSLANEIQLVYYKVQALTRLGQHQAAWDAAAQLSDKYPLVELALTWSKSNPQSALAIVEKMDREADKAQALRAVAVATNNPADFERALGMALAARVRNDSLAPVRASLDLALAFLPVDVAKAQLAFEQAYQAALRITTK